MYFGPTFSTVRAILMQATLALALGGALLNALTWGIDSKRVSPSVIAVALAFGVLCVIAEVYGPSAGWRVGWTTMATLAAAHVVAWVVLVPFHTVPLTANERAYILLTVGPHAVLRGDMFAYLLSGLAVWTAARICARYFFCTLPLRLLMFPTLGVTIFTLTRAMLGIVLFNFTPIGPALTTDISSRLFLGLMACALASPLLLVLTFRLRLMEWRLTVAPALHYFQEREEVSHD